MRRDGDEAWISVITAPAYAPMASWLRVMQSLIRHPERNSSNILRADVLSETTPTNGEREGDGQGWIKHWTIKRALLPRRPNLDWRMEQDCTLFHRTSSNQAPQHAPGHTETDDAHDEEEAIREAVVIYTPLVGAETHPKMALPDGLSALLGQPPPSEELIPFYHPKVRALAFHYRPAPPSSDANGDTVHGELGISLIPFKAHATENKKTSQKKEAATTTKEGEGYAPTHRLSRVALSLLTTLHMHTWGDVHSYQKRVHHDNVVPRELYQDTYLELKRRYAGELIAGWAEATDPTKHVFEEMGIAAFLISLWTLTYNPSPGDGKSGPVDEGWKARVKFVDVGCGNGLLSYILTREGFAGIGLDLRARKSWANYATRGAQLQEWSFHPSALLSPSPPDHIDAQQAQREAEVWRGTWLLGNHADELTPWLPVLATHYAAAGFINLPCCYYALDGTRAFPLLLKRAGEVSRNEQYLAYIAELHARFGWLVELEPLRIPSTKNWCFVGRTRTHSRRRPAEEKVDRDGEEEEEGEGEMKKRVQLAVEQALASGWAARTST